MVKRLC